MKFFTISSSLEICSGDHSVCGLALAAAGVTAAAPTRPAPVRNLRRLVCFFSCPGRLFWSSFCPLMTRALTLCGTDGDNILDCGIAQATCASIGCPERTLSRQVDESEIIAHYSRREARAKPRLPMALDGMTLSTSAFGIGDAVILSDLPRAGHQNDRFMSIFSPSEHFQTLMSFNPYYKPRLTPFCAIADVLYLSFDLGNGHVIQRLRRAYGLPIDLKPRGCIEVPGRTRRSRIALHFEAGAQAEWQRRHIRPDARILSSFSRAAIEALIAARLDFEFVEIGKRSCGIRGAVDYTGLSLSETIEVISSAQYFIGIMSGPMHLAAAMNLKLICITNFPSAELICLPTLKDIDQVESEWFYPQSVILHQDGEGPFVKQVSLENLERALDGELYPYWSDRYLPLIEE